MPKSRTFSNDLLALVFNGTSIANLAINASSAPLTSLYFALHLADPGEAGSQTTNEMAYTGYTRVAVARIAGGFLLTASGIVATTAIDWPTMTGGAGGLATFVSIGTALSGAGKILYSGPIAPEINVGVGTVPRIISVIVNEDAGAVGTTGVGALTGVSATAVLGTTAGPHALTGVAATGAVGQLGAGARILSGVAATSAVGTLGRVRLRALTSVVATGSGGTLGAPSGDSLTTDAFPTYTTYWVDTVTGSSGNSGLTEGSPKATIAQGLALCSGSGAQRVIVSGDTTLAADLTFPVSGVSNSARIVLMGHPTKTMPKITLGAFSVRPSKNAARPYVTIRKFEILDGDATAGLSGIEVGLNNAMDNFEAAFLYVHNIRRTNDDNCGAIYLKDSAAANAWIHHCKLSDVKLNTGADFHNGSAIHAYQNVGVIVEYCDLFNAANGCRWKEPPTGTSGGPIIRYCKVYTCSQFGIILQNDNAITGASFGGAKIYNNLFYNIPATAFDIYDPNNVASALDIYQNTFAEDVGGSDSSSAVVEIRGCNGVVYHSNVCLGPFKQFLTKDPGSSSNRISEINYNVYRNTGSYSTGMYTGSQKDYSTLTAWKSAKTTDAQADWTGLITANPDPNSTTVTTLSTDFTNTGARDYSIKAGSALLATGKAGVNPGYDKTKCGCGF